MENNRLFLPKKLIFISKNALDIESLTTSFAQAAEKENFKEDCIIASSNTVAIYLLPDIMESLVTAFPLINFSIQLMNSNEVVDMVQNNHAHIGLIENPLKPKIYTKKLFMKIN